MTEPSNTCVQPSVTLSASDATLHQHAETNVGTQHAHSGSFNTNVSVKKIGVIGLMGMVISAMVGGGIYSLPQNMAVNASAGGQIIAWIITGIGMWFIANTFRILARVRPELKNGMYNYAYHGFGRFVGFLTGYGYCICNIFAVVAYGVLIMSTLDFFFPGTFTNGSNIWGTIGASIISWIMVALAMRGVRVNAMMNLVGTVCKIVPVLIFIVAMITVFQLGTFLHGFWGMSADGHVLAFNWDNVMSQASNTMLVTLWLFIGIEGAVVISGNAKSQKAVSQATTFGYLSVLIVYVLVSLLPLGLYSSSTIAGMANPSMATIMTMEFGDWGGVLVNVGVIISVVAAWLVWLVMISQMLLYGAHDGVFPKRFKQRNRHGAPSFSLLMAGVVCQVLLIGCHFLSGSAWNTMISITSVLAMPCYLMCCLFLWKIVLAPQWRENGRFSRGYAAVTAVFGTIFALYLVYSAGLDYLLIGCVVYALGIPLFIVGRRQSGNPQDGGARVFTKPELVLMVLVVIAGIFGVIHTITSGMFA